MGECIVYWHAKYRPDCPSSLPFFATTRGWRAECKVCGAVAGLAPGLVEDVGGVVWKLGEDGTKELAMGAEHKCAICCPDELRLQSVAALALMARDCPYADHEAWRRAARADIAAAFALSEREEAEREDR